MIRYQKSASITVQQLNSDLFPQIPERYNTGYFVLRDGSRDREYLINQSINYFLGKFSIARTPLEVIAEISNELGGDPSQLERACLSFFKFLCRRRILIPENKVEPTAITSGFFDVGSLVNGYEVERVISNRHYSEVYQVKDTRDNQVSVLKFLNRGKSRDKKKYEEDLDELENEFRLLKKVQHVPAICRVYEFNKDLDTGAILRIEYIDGKSLSSFLRESQPLSPADTLNIIRQLLCAFAALHESNIIHGDIHSSNILVTSAQEVRIIDLGLSREVIPDSSALPTFGGVDYYMPPERIRVASRLKYTREPDLYSDVYQIGLLMYLAVYGELPFSGFIWEELAKNIKEAPVTFPSNSFSGIRAGPGLQKIIRKCLDKKPGKRYKNASELLSDFEKLPPVGEKSIELYAHG